MKRVLIYDISYDLSREDIIDACDLTEDSSDKDIEKGHQLLIRSLPASIITELPEDIDDTNEDEVGDYLADFITESTGYLVNSFAFEFK